MLLLRLGMVLAFLPLGLKELVVVIGNQKYPNKVLSIGRSDFIHKDFKMPELKRLSKENLATQLFNFQEAWNGGVVFKTFDNLRSFRHFDTLKFKSFTETPQTPIIHIIKAGTKYPGTFQIVVDKQCLDAVMGYDKETIYPRFNDCSNTVSQIWGAFTEDQARSYLGLKPITDDKSEINLRRMIQKIHEESFPDVIV